MGLDVREVTVAAQKARAGTPGDVAVAATRPRARTLSGRLSVDQEAGTKIVLELPATAARQ